MRRSFLEHFSKLKGFTEWPDKIIGEKNPRQGIKHWSEQSQEIKEEPKSFCEWGVEWVEQKQKYRLSVLKVH